ncbi:MAG TPA: Ger(x)C family spore germination protein [Bacillota bacterium]|nr:Ger(x)C family spore germination protein [Bacillota bacterium]
MKLKRMLYLLLLLLLSTSGCWDVRDVNSMAFAVSIGIDQPADPSTAKYKVTLEFANPVPGKPIPQSLISSAEGQSIHQAVQRIQASISRTISFSHLRVLVVGELLARERDFKDISNYLMKNPEVALRLRLLFIEGDEARGLFSIKPKYGQLLASELVAMGELQQQLSLVRTNHFYTFWLNLKNSNGTALASRAILKDEKKTFAREGAALYKNWKLIAWLDGADAQAANWLVQKTRAVVVTNDGGISFTYQVSKTDTQITPEMKDGKLSFLVKVATVGMVMEETGGDLDFSKEKNIKKVETLFTKTIKQQIESAISKSQRQLQIDYLGFGKTFKQYQPKIFKSLNWPEVYPKIPVTVEVHCKVNSTGLQT